MRGEAARSPMRFRRLRWTTAITAGALLWFGANARATTVTVGSPLTALFKANKFRGVGTVANSALPEPGARVISPISGTIARWRMLLAEGGPYRLRVLRHVGGTSFTGVGTSSPETPSSLGPQTFATNLPIHAGDTIGIDNSAGSDKLGVAEVPGADYLFWVSPLPEGATIAGELGEGGYELAFNADVQLRPSVSSISPTSGPSTGGTAVTIAGSDFNGVSAVEFGGHPAVSYSVNSEEEIVAASPAADPGPVDVTVTTAAGMSATSPVDAFTFTAPPVPVPVVPAAAPVVCVVPKLKGRKLKAAKRALRKRHCGIGKVIREPRKEAPRKAKIFKQRPQPRAVRPAESKVHVWLRVRKRHRKRSAR
jgi:hypothetical protein